MDIYSLINSKAISEHCRKIAHQFTPLEAAYLVNDNGTMTLAQKHEAFREIIREGGDIEVAERPWTPHFDSMREFLNAYMDAQNNCLDTFYRDEPNCVYSFSVWYASDEEHCEDPRLFPDWDSCYKAILFDIDDLAEGYKDSENDVSPIDIRVTKTWLSTEGEEYPKHLTICITHDNAPMDIWESNGVTSEQERDVLFAFEGLWPEIPTPFQKGDILVTRKRNGKEETPFVLDWIPYWEEDGKYTRIVEHMREGGDRSDLGTTIYGQSEDGTIWCDHGPCYLELEYCGSELCGPRRFLIALSNYIKGELSLELLLRSYDIYKNERRANEERFYLNSAFSGTLGKTGLSKNTETHD